MKPGKEPHAAREPRVGHYCSKESDNLLASIFTKSGLFWVWTFLVRRHDWRRSGNFLWRHQDLIKDFKWHFICLSFQNELGRTLDLSEFYTAFLQCDFLQNRIFFYDACTAAYTVVYVKPFATSEVHSVPVTTMWIHHTHMGNVYSDPAFQILSTSRSKRWVLCCCAL